MKFIQCPYCSKKYAVNDRVSASVGKSIRCKDCKQSFEIIILDAADQSQSPADNNVSDQPVSANNLAHKSKPMGKRLNYQYLILITLLSLLGIATAAIITYYVYPGLFKSVIEQPKQSKKNDRQSNLASIEAAHIKKTAASADSKKKQASNQAREIPPPSKSLLEGPENPDQNCKDAAVRQWVSDRVLIVGEIPPEMYTKLLNQSLALTANVRTLCKDKFLVGRITEAAKINIKPEWIKKEIEAVLITH